MGTRWKVLAGRKPVVSRDVAPWITSASTASTAPNCAGWWSARGHAPYAGMTPDRLRIGKAMRKDNASIRATAEAFGVGRSTVARHLARQPPSPRGAWIAA